MGRTFLRGLVCNQLAELLYTVVQIVINSCDPKFMMKRLLAAALFSISLMPVSAFAAESTAPTTPTLSAEERVAKCEAFKTRVAERLTAMDSRTGKNTDRFNAALSKLNTLIEKAKGMDVDTSALEASIATLQSDVAKLATDQSALRSHLSSISSIDCSAETLEAWQKRMEDGKALFAAVKADVTAVKTLNKSIKEEVKAIVTVVRANTVPPAVTE